MKLKCIIVDDEPLAHVVLEKYISQIQSLELLAKCKNALEAINFLHENMVDIIFLDINMPELSGLEMLKTLKKQPEIILTTAYSEFALESYEFGVKDYLLKPIKFDRFLKAVNRVIDSKTVVSPHIPEPAPQTEQLPNDFIFVKQDQSVFNVKYSDIQYIEALGNYLQVHTAAKKFVTRETMTDMEKTLPDKIFIRVHKSFIVNLSKIEKIVNNQIFIAGKEISIGTIYKSELMKKLENWCLFFFETVIEAASL